MKDSKINVTYSLENVTLHGVIHSVSLKTMIHTIIFSLSVGDQHCLEKPSVTHSFY